MSRNRNSGIVRYTEPAAPAGWVSPFRSLFGGFDDMRREIDQLFWNAFGRPVSQTTEAIGPVDLYETDEALRLTVQVPGVEQKDLDLSVTPDTITISGERKGEEESESGRYHVKQTWQGSFKQSFRLPVEVDAKAVKALLKNGVLTVTLPKAEAQKSSTVKIEVE